MRYMIACCFVLSVGLFAQEEAEADTAFIEEDEFMEEDELMVEEADLDTTEAPDEEAAPAEPAGEEGLAAGYKGLAWGASIDQLATEESADTTSVGVDSAATSKTVYGTLGEDTVSFTYHFSDQGFWKVVIDYTDIAAEEGVENYLGHFHRIEKALYETYGPPTRTSQNEMGTDREYLFSDFPKLSRAYFRSSWSADPANIELLLEAVVPQSSDDPPVFEGTSRYLRLYYYNAGFFGTADGDTTKADTVKSLSDIY